MSSWYDDHLCQLIAKYHDAQQIYGPDTNPNEEYVKVSTVTLTFEQATWLLCMSSWYDHHLCELILKSHEVPKSHWPDTNMYFYYIHLRDMHKLHQPTVTLTFKRANMVITLNMSSWYDNFCQFTSNSHTAPKSYWSDHVLWTFNLKCEWKQDFFFIWPSLTYFYDLTLPSLTPPRYSRKKSSDQV